MNILVLDDEKEIADLVEVYLKNENYNVFKFYDSKEALKCIENQKLDVAILDVMIKDVDGFEICKMIRDKGLNFPVIMLTAKIEDKDKIQWLTLGADDYIVKPFRTRELISRIKSVLRRYGKKEENNIIQYKDIKIDTISAKVYKNNKEIIFTSLEYRILLMLFTNQNKLITREQLLEKIWDIAGNFVNDNTLTVYIKRIREKLEDDSIIKTVRGLGYRIGD